MLRKILPVVVGMGIVVTPTFASEQAITQFFYNQGFTQGYALGFKRGYYEGYLQAIKDYSAILKAYRKDIQALEAGKYLLRNQMLTYPRVVKEVTKDGLKLKVICPKFEDIRNLDDIAHLNIPVVDETFVKEVQKAKQDLIEIPETAKAVLQTAPKPPKVYTFTLPASEKEKVDKLNFPYIEDEGKKEIKVVVIGKDNLQKFCKAFPKQCR